MAPRQRYQSIKSIKATKQEERRSILKLCKHKFKAIEDFDYLPSTRSVLIKNHLKVLIKEDLLQGVDENKTVQGKEINLNSRTLAHDDLRFKINSRRFKTKSRTLVRDDDENKTVQEKEIDLNSRTLPNHYNELNNSEAFSQNDDDGENFWIQEPDSHHFKEMDSSNSSEQLAVPVIVSTRNDEEYMSSYFESQNSKTFTLNTVVTTRLSYTENFSSQDLEGWW